MDVASLGIAVDSSQAKGASGDLNALTESARRADVAVDNLGDSAQTTAGSFDRMSASVSKAGTLARYSDDIGRVGKNTQVANHHLSNMVYQLNDVGVSLASGQNPMMVFIQQGSQIGQIAGQSGASVGAWARALGLFNPVLLATTAAVGVAAGAFALFKSDVDKAANNKEFVKSLGLTDKELKKLGDTSVTAGDMFKGLWKVIDEGNRVSSVFSKIKDFAVSSFRTVLDWIKKLTAGVWGAWRAFEMFKAGDLNLWGNFISETQKAEAAIDGFFSKWQAKSVEASQERLTATAAGIRSNRSDRTTRQPRYEGILSPANDNGFDIGPLRQYGQELQFVWRAQTEMEAAQERWNLQVKMTPGIINPAEQAMEKWRLTARDLAEDLGHVAAFGGKIGDVFDYTFRRMAASWAANRIESMFSKILDVAFNSSGQSGGSGASGGFGGFVKSLFSFDGGGYTGNGSRSGGVDGKGGFPAILHPRETVVDHTKGQGGAPISIRLYVDQDGNWKAAVEGIAASVAAPIAANTSRKMIDQNNKDLPLKQQRGQQRFG